MTRLDPAHPLARALAEGRERYNALFEAARVRHDALDGADVLATLVEAIAPVLESAESASSSTLDALYPVVLDAVGTARVGPGARQPEMSAAWARVLAGCREHVVRDARRVASASLAALGTIAATPGAQPLRWADRLGELANTADTIDALLNAGAVLAWREGLARYRTAALDACARLASPTALAALGIADSPDHRSELATAFDRLRADPWLAPEAAFQTPAPRPLAIRTVCGDFSGYGGSFLRPPTLAATAHGLVASDGENAYRLHADAFGTAFERVDFASSALNAASTGEDMARMGSDGTVLWGDHRQRFVELAGSGQVASSRTTLAVGIPGSHRIALIAPSA